MNVLFVCKENAGRSQIAEHLFNASVRGLHEGRSAGTTPIEGIHPAAVRALARRAIDAGAARPSSPAGPIAW